MGRNLVVLRQSPHWPTFDLENTRAFCAAVGLRETLILDFAARWNAVCAVDFLTYRHEMKSIALATLKAVSGSTFQTIDSLDVHALDDEDRIFFSDDDDWAAPDLFERLQGPGGDGWIWRSAFVGKLFADTPLEKVGGPVLQKRPASSIVYTNNYVVSGQALKRIGSDVMVEHYHAQAAMDDGRYRPSRCDDFLSAANKHLACTVFINVNMGAPDFVADMRAGVSRYADELSAVRLDDDLAWMVDPLARLVELNRQAAG